MRDDSILDRLAEAGSADEAVGLFHYHGTGEPFDGPPEGGAYDGILWLADSPAVAQTYIPAAGTESLLALPRFREGDKVRPGRHSDWYAMVLQMGHESPDIDWGSDGSARSWATPPGYPTYGDVCDWLERDLGYVNECGSPDRERHYQVKTRFDGGRSVFLPADYLAPGRLFAVDGVRDLRMLDMATGREGDLGEPDYHRHSWFRRAEQQGYDGIMINDFCQSRTHGNVGHVSWGLLPRGVAKVRHAVLPAVRFDWAADESCARRMTPDFEAAWIERRQPAARPR